MPDPMEKPSEHEAERASASYLMSVVAVIAGLPLPIINLIANAVYYYSNRKSTWFVRWHCMQALVSQLILLPVNTIGFWWTLAIVFSTPVISNEYISYMITLIVVNLIEFGATIYSAIETRKGNHVVWLFFGDVTNRLVRS